MLFERTGAHENVDQNAAVLIGTYRMFCIWCEDNDIA